MILPAELLSLGERKGPAPQAWEGEGERLITLTLPQLRCSLPLPQGEGI